MANADWGHAQGYPAQVGQGTYQSHQAQPQGYAQPAPQAHPAGGHYAPQPQQGYRAEPPMHAQPQGYGAPQPQMQPQMHNPQPQASQHYAPQTYSHQIHQQPQAYAAPQHAPQPQVHDAAAYYGVEAAPTPVAAEPGRFSKAMNVFGAVVSVALIGGLGVWGYKLAMRDVTEIPVVAALEGPMRVQPENPGGVAADHQGLAVNNVAAEGVAAGPAAQVVLAPAPQDLEEVDTPVVAEAEIAAMSGAEAGDSRPAEPEATVTPAAAAPVDAREATQRLIDEITAEVAPLSDDEADLALSEDAEALTLASADSVVTLSTEVPGVVRSLVPPARPSGLVTRAAAQPATDPLLSAGSSNVREVAAADIPVGTRLVQLGAYDSEDVARAEWEAMATKFDEFMGDKSRVIEKAQSGGKTFYRLRAMGFDDLSDARRFCSALMAGQAACIPVVTR